MVLGLAALVSAQEPKAAAPATPEREPGLYATFTTSIGTMVCKLFEKEAPLTVANFVGLARGAKEWTDPKTGQKVKRPLYNGTIFHRVIPGFMIQGGDPLGTGMGDPGYKFRDEISPDLKFDQPGRLAMANSGPNTNGSQFFITEVPTPHLNKLHTIFGQVVEGQELIKQITGVPKDGNDKPRTPVVLKNVRIQRFPLAAPAKKEGASETKTAPAAPKKTAPVSKAPAK
ncbi:MAG: peptidylprolyl isomerase [Acidobacteria bacterium]|nr:peptidylprolyl isomerase [Acidobacteriota bacterium]